MDTFLHGSSGGDGSGAGTARALLPRDIALWMFQLLSGLSAIHRCNLLHRDLKPENLYLTATNAIKIGDLGLAAAVSNSLKGNGNVEGLGGSYAFMAPEVFEKRVTTEKSDVWSLVT